MMGERREPRSYRESGYRESNYRESSYRESGYRGTGERRPSYRESGYRDTAERRPSYRESRYRDQQGQTPRTRASQTRASQNRPQQNRASQDDAVHYRRARRVAIRQRRFWWAYIGIAAVVAVATVFGIAFSFAGPPVPRGESSPPVYTPGSPESEAASASSSSSSASQEDLSKRDADFAVNPDRKDWNYSTNGRKTVYLTIDDGPSAQTEKVLDILDQYNCKATFFVVGHNEEYFPMIAEAYRRGHTIGMHTYSHDYAEVYSSVDAYFADLNAIAEVVKSQIGYVPCFIRFPGGSSNMVSASYCEGIMTALVADVQERGYQYYDWNLSVGDGSEHTTEEIVGYGTEGDGEDNIMLLCHDSATKQTTVEALPKIIEHYQSLGYTFEAIDRESWVCHHEVSN